MQGNQLRAEEVLTRCDAARNVEGDLTLVGNELVHCPFAARIKAVMVNLEPLQARDARLGGRRNLGTIACA